jgi:PAS domain-containing protein
MTENHNLITSSESKYLFKHFFELSADLLCIAGFDGYFKRINPAVSQLLGYTNEELFSKPINDFIHIDDREYTSKLRAFAFKLVILIVCKRHYQKLSVVFDFSISDTFFLGLAS